MDFIDNLIQTLYDIIDNLFWFSPGIGPRKIKKLNVFIASFAMVVFICFIYQLIL